MGVQRMSVILESQPGNELVCIDEFHASPDGEGFSWDSSRTFRVGERVRYLSFRQDPNRPDSPVCWLVVYRAADGKDYAATQTYFVTEDGWRRLKRFFARRLLREPRRRTALLKRGPSLELCHRLPR
jgi:hypothetical protein